MSTGVRKKSLGKRKARGLDPGVAFRLHKELSKQTRSDDMTLELVDESDLTEWRVLWYYGNEKCPTPTEQALAAQLKARGLECIELRVDVPPEYPAAPPKARGYFPRVKGSFVQPSGAICAEAHSKQGWGAAHTIETMVRGIRALLQNDDDDDPLRLQTVEDGDCTPKVLEMPYDKAEAVRGAAELDAIHSGGFFGSAGSS